jgi:hypothetical protein
VTLPSIQLNAGARPAEAIGLLRELAMNCYSEAQPASATHPVDKRDVYVTWAARTEGRLRTILTTAEAARLFSDPRYRDICSMAPGGHLLPLISAEIDVLSHRLASLADELDLTRRLFDGSGTCLVPDTSFFIEHERKLEDVDFHVRAPDPGRVSVLVPMVDELDGLKKGSSTKTRWRAGYSLAVIDTLVTDPPSAGVLTAQAHLPPRGRRHDPGRPRSERARENGNQ